MTAYVVRRNNGSRVMAALRQLEAEEGAAAAGKQAKKAAPSAPLAKLEPTKPGKRTPTKDEKAWMDAVVAYGCIACHIDGARPRPTAVHHLLRGGRRIGHKHTIGLCDPGHHQGGKLLNFVSRHPDKAQFEKKYGTEAQLLKRTQKVLKKQKDGSYAP